MSDVKELVEDIGRSLKNARRGQVLISVASAEEIKGILSEIQLVKIISINCEILE